MRNTAIVVLAILLAICVITEANLKGLTWKVEKYIDDYNVVKVGCSGCDAYHGDTSCSASLPILCASKTNFNRPPYDSADCSTCAMPKWFYNSWSGGYIAITPATIQGSAIGSRANADKFCQKYLGPEFVAAYHGLGKYVNQMSTTKYFFDTWPSAVSSMGQGGGWSSYGYGKINSSGRFWTFIGDQKANCWN